MISKFFIHRPVFASVISILLLLLGAVAAVNLPVAQYPELAPPVVRVEAIYPGANAQVIADTVAIPIEEQVNGVDRMIYMNSTSSDGRYALDISFEPGTNVDEAAVLVQNRVNIAEPRLPEEVRRQGVSTRKQSTALVGVISLSSPSKKYDDLFLANYLAINLRDEVLRIYGVGGTNILPSKDYGMRIWLDPLKLKARNLTVNDVAGAIREQNAIVAAGAIGREPAPAGNDFELLVNTRGRLQSPEEFANIIIKTGADSSVVRVKDVGRVELGTRDYSTLSTFNGSPNAVLVCYQLPGANLVDVASKIDQKVKDFQKRIQDQFGEDIKAQYFYDASMFIEASLFEVVKTLIEAFLLVFIVVLIFLQSWRTTLIPALTIPVSLIGTFALLLLFGFSINMLTMFGLVLAIGIVVDDAIVVVENVERNMSEYGLGAVEATIKAMGEITGPVIAITLVLMSVFLPAAALPGITGQMYRQFALTIAASTLLSAICALTLAPALCALLLKGLGHGHAGSTAHRTFILFRPLAWAGRIFNRVFDWFTAIYAGIIRLTCRFAVVTILLFAGVIAGTLVLLQRVPTGFIPNEDLGFVVVAAQLPDGASLQRTKAVIDRVSQEVSQVEGVQNIVTLSGFSVIVGNGTPYGNAWIVLKPWDERAKTGRSVEKILAEINARVQPIQEATFLVFSLPAIQGLGNTSGVELKLLDQASLGRESLQLATSESIGQVFTQSKMAYAYSPYRSGVPQVFLDVDREKAIRLGIPLDAVFGTLQAFLGSAYVNDFNQFNKTYQVSIQADAPYRLQTGDILRLEVRNRSGQMIPLSTFVRVQDGFGPERVERYQMYPSSTVTAVAKPGTSSGEAIAIMEGIAGTTLPRGMGYAWSSMAYQEKIAGAGLKINLFGTEVELSNAIIAFSLGILIVYLILAAQYESFATPLAVVLSVPLVATGAVIALLYRGLDNNVFTQIGVVLLIGLGAKNAILIVEFARENRAAGKTIVDSAVEAARTRFRPILMTSFAFILGVVPLLNAAGAGAASRRALGTAVFGGMTGATILGVLLIPAIYVAVQTVAEKIFGRKEVVSHSQSKSQ